MSINIIKMQAARLGLGGKVRTFAKLGTLYIDFADGEWVGVEISQSARGRASLEIH